MAMAGISTFVPIAVVAGAAIYIAAPMIEKELENTVKGAAKIIMATGELIQKELKKKRLRELLMSTLAEAAATAQLVRRNRKPTDRVVDCEAIGDMSNYYTDMKIKDKHAWCGQFLSDPPSWGEGQIHHEGRPPHGSKAGVAYSSNGQHWILAWHVPLPSQQNKIYVECGIDRPVDWNVIERKLDASGRESECDGGIAIIENGSNPAILAAVFDNPS